MTSKSHPPGLIAALADLLPLASFADPYYSSWSLTLKQILKIEGLWLYVSGDIKLPFLVCTSDEVAVGHRARMLQASGLIMMALSEKLRAKFFEDKYDDPVKLWKRIGEFNADSKEWEKHKNKMDAFYGGM
jgi:hypothetical protein